MTRIVQIGIYCLWLLATEQLHSQNLNCEWIHSFGGIQGDDGWDATSDSQGNFIIAGQFSGEIDIDPSENEFILSSNTSQSAFLAKYSPNQELIWAYNLGEGNYSYIWKVISLEDDRIMICGEFYETCDFDFSVEQYILESSGFGDAFIAIYTSEGEIDIAKSIGGNLGDNTLCGACDTEGNIYFGGHFTGSIDLDPSSNEFVVNSYNAAMLDMFIVKLTPTGEFIWGGTVMGPGLEIPADMCFDNQQNIIVAGLVEGDADFDLSDNIQYINAQIETNNFNCFIAKYSGDGELSEGFVFGGVGDDFIRTMIPNSSGYIINGYYSGNGDFDPGDNILNLSTFGEKDAFLIQLDFEFNTTWSYNLGNDGEDTFNDLALDAYGNIVACGSFEISIDFDPSDEEFVLTVPETVEGVYTDAFVLVLSADGQFKEAENFGGWKSDNGYGVAVSDNKMLLLGNFEYEATSGACLATVNSAGEPYSDDVFALCFNSEYLNVGKDSEQQFKIYPNPTNDELYIQCATPISSIEIFDITGRIVYTEQPNAIGATVNIKSLSTGCYFLSAKTETGKIAALKFLKE
jgi:hypothetical protein